MKGYEYEKGKYAIVEPAELKNLRLAGKKTIEIFLSFPGRVCGATDTL